MKASRTAAKLAQSSFGEGSPEHREGAFRLLIDTAEQQPWQPPPDVAHEVTSLNTGDYSVDRYQDRVCIERKGLDDFVMCTQSRTEKIRFHEELKRMAEMDFAVVVVEATTRDIWEHKYRPSDFSTRRQGASSKWAAFLDTLKPQDVLDKGSTIHVAFGVPVLFIGSPTRSARYAFNLLRGWWVKERNQ